MEKKCIVTKKERKVSKMEDNEINETQTGVRRNTKSEIIVESSVIKTEILTESLQIERSAGDTLVDHSKSRINDELKLPSSQISGGDFARTDEVENGTSDSSAYSRITVASRVFGECGSFRDNSNYSSGNRRIFKKRKTLNDVPDNRNDNSAPSDSQQHRASIFKNLKRKSLPLKDFSKSVKISPEIDKENPKANVSFVNRSSNDMKITDNFLHKVGSSTRSKEIKKGKDGSQIEGGSVNKTNLTKDSIDDILNTAEEGRNNLNITSCDSSFKNELIDNLKESVSDLVNYFENLQKSISEQSGTKFTLGKPEKIGTGGRKMAETNTKDPRTSESMLLPMERRSNENEDPKSRSLGDDIQPLDCITLNGMSKIKEVPPSVENNNLKQRYPKEHRFIFSENIPKNSRNVFRNRGRTRSKLRNIKNWDQMAETPHFGIIKPKQEIGISAPIFVRTENIAEFLKNHSIEQLRKDEISITEKDKQTFHKKASVGEVNRGSFSSFAIVLFVVVLAASSKLLFKLCFN